MRILLYVLTGLICLVACNNNFNRNQNKNNIKDTILSYYDSIEEKDEPISIIYIYSKDSLFMKKAVIPDDIVDLDPQDTIVDTIWTIYMKHLFYIYNKEQYYEVFDPYGGDKIFIVDSTKSKYEEDPRGMYKLNGKLKKMYMSFVYGF